jgi:hypothetical protein
MIFYAGIGARDTPPEICSFMQRISHTLSKRGYILRSGGATGADTAFEEGAKSANGRMEIFLPWDGFNGRKIDDIEYFLGDFSDISLEIARKFHPAYHKLGYKGRKFMMRNNNQMFGKKIGKSRISSFIICWTKDGKASGGTGQAIRIAEYSKIKVFNLQRKEDFEFWYNFCCSIEKKGGI